MESIARKLLLTGELRQRAEAAHLLLSCCTLCPRRCRVDRLGGETGICRTAAQARIASYGPHFGEEAPLVGSRGSGTIFVAGCNLCCCFCQNYDISQGEEPAQEVTDHEFAAIMLELQAMGCHNINLVTPSHVVPQILAALIPALENGLDIPLIYNCSGYESLETLALLAGVWTYTCRMPNFGSRRPPPATPVPPTIRSGCGRRCWRCNARSEPW